MISRYSRKEMQDIWTEHSKFDAYLKVEKLACEAFSVLGVIPKEDILLINQNASFDLEKIKEIELETKHDIIAFTRAVSLTLGEEKKWIHYGLTSTDVVDTANGYILKKVNDILEKQILDFLKVLQEKAIRYRHTPCIGRTHGIHADITTFGLKWALWYDNLNRNYKNFKQARLDVECGKVSGAVGNFANVDPFIQDYVCNHLGIQSADISTQVLNRDRHANYMSVLALIASTLEQIATEIRSLQRTEIFEVEETFVKGQKGSSAMPHKRNPISSENICGCARVIRGYMNIAFDNINLWNERDISHSSAERIMLPDATILLDYMLNRYKTTIKNLVVYDEKMIANIYQTKKVIFAQRVMNLLIDKNLSREVAYDLIQPIAKKALDENLDYQELIKQSDEIVNILKPEEIDQCFTFEYYFKNVDYIYKKVGLTK